MLKHTFGLLKQELSSVWNENSSNSLLCCFIASYLRRFIAPSTNQPDYYQQSLQLPPLSHNEIFSIFFEIKIPHSNLLTSPFWPKSTELPQNHCKKDMLKIDNSNCRMLHRQCKLCQSYFRPLLIAFLCQINNLFFLLLNSFCHFLCRLFSSFKSFAPKKFEF